MASGATVKLGQCEECGEPNPYTALICAYCQARLPWADAIEAVAHQAASAPPLASAPAAPNAPSRNGFVGPLRSADWPASVTPLPDVPAAAQGFVQAAHPSPCDPARVRVSARILDWPYTCACCGQSLEGPGAVGHKVLSVSTRSAIIPYCATCAEHVQLATSGDNALGCCLLLAVLGFFPLFVLFQAIAGSSDFALLSTLVTCAALILAGFQDRQRKLAAARALTNAGCCTLRHAVVPGFGLGANHSFIFKRREYAEAFIQANRAKVIG